MAGKTSMIALRTMTAADVPAVAAIERVSYSTPWSEKIFVDELRQDSRVYVVADDDGEVAGYGGLFLIGEEGHVTTMAVAPDHQGAGVGTRILLHLVEAGLSAGMRHMTLEVRPSNEAAQALYRKFGLETVGRRKDYYPDEDALIMWANHMDTPEYGERLDAIRGEL